MQSAYRCCTSYSIIRTVPAWKNIFRSHTVKIAVIQCILLIYYAALQHFTVSSNNIKLHYTKTLMRTRFYILHTPTRHTHTHTCLLYTSSFTRKKKIHSSEKQQYNSVSRCTHLLDDSPPPKFDE